MIQCFARFHPTPSRLRVRRIDSGLRTRAVHPFSWHTAATGPRVHRLVGLPSVRGDWWSNPFRSSSRVRGHVGWVAFGALGLAVGASAPRAWKARIASPTVWVAHPRVPAIRDGRCPAALAKRIWDRRSTNASADRRPRRGAASSSAVRSRTKRGGFIPLQ